MNADSIRRSLRRWQLGTVVVAMTTASAGITFALLGPDAGYLPIPALVGWVLPLVLHGFLRRASEAVNRKPTSLGMAIGAMFVGIVLVPVMLHRTAKTVGEAAGDRTLTSRQTPLLVGWVLAQFVPTFLGILLGFGVAWGIGGLAQVVLLALMAQQLQNVVVEHVEMRERPVERFGDATGHQVPVAVRS